MVENSNMLTQVAEFMKLERSRRRWRVVAAIAVLLLFLSFIAFVSAVKVATPMQNPHVAQVTIGGMITDDLYQQQVLEELGENAHTKAVIVYVDSAGGTMVGGINLFNTLRTIAEEKPVVTVMGTVAASAGYMVAAAGDYVIANPGSITGSIGVLMPLVDATELAQKVGIKSDEVTSGVLKAATSPLSKRGPNAKAYLQKTVEEMQKVFMDMVLSRRTLNQRSITEISDGRIITGLRAKDLGLVDALGSRKNALKWLEKEHDLPQIPLVDVTTEKPESFFKQLLSQTWQTVFSNEWQQAIIAKL